MNLGITTSLLTTINNSNRAAQNGLVIGSDSTTADGNKINGTDLDNADGTFSGTEYFIRTGIIESIRFEATFYGSPASDTKLNDFRMIMVWNGSSNAAFREIINTGNTDSTEVSLSGLSNGDDIDVTFDDSSARLYNYVTGQEAAFTFPYNLGSLHTGYNDFRANFAYSISEGSGSVSRLESIKVTITYE